MERTEQPRDRLRDRSLILLACLLAPVSGAEAQAPTTGTYLFEYPYNTPELIEDHFIVLEGGGSELRGWYYGTSDEFDAGREGYLPGFFVAPLTGLSVAGDAISFTLNRPGRFFVAPVPRRYRDAEDVPAGMVAEWNVPLPTDSRQYAGTLRGGQIVLDVPGGPRVFQRTESER
jgi:hypothetical protein